jgi:4-hydroxybenzoate polyprenyltransferase
MSFFSACYAAGGLAVVSLLAGVSLSPWLCAAAFTMAWFVYLLHRVRIARRDGSPMTARRRVLERHSGVVHAMLWCTGFAAIVTALLVTPWLLLLLAASVAGMIFYGSGPDGSRLRDKLLMKNMCVGLSMSLFWLLLLIFSNLNATPSAGVLLPIGVSMLFMVLGDAMYCDVCDVQADAQTRSRTVPIRWGALPTRWIADGCITISAIVLLAWPRQEVDSAVAWTMVPLLLLLLQAALHAVRENRVRSAVDVRLLLLPLLVWAGSDLLSSTT